jgi:hypothetical protein
MIANVEDSAGSLHNSFRNWFPVQGIWQPLTFFFPPQNMASFAYFFQKKTPFYTLRTRFFSKKHFCCRYAVKIRRFGAGARKKKTKRKNTASLKPMDPWYLLQRCVRT